MAVYSPPFFCCALTILEDGVATSAAVFANNARKLDDEDLAVVFNNIGGRRHSDDTVHVHRVSLLFSFFLRIPELDLLYPDSSQ
jgi:hypothetical protein